MGGIKRKTLQAEKSRQRRAHKTLKRMVEYHDGDGDWIYQIPEAPTFFPTQEEFEDPIRYIQKIQGEACRFGICKVVPPVCATTPPAKVINSPGEKEFAFTTRQQVVQQPAWERFDSGHFKQSGKKVTLSEFEKLAGDFQRERFGLNATLPAKIVEAEYWRQFEGKEGLLVEYGNDVEGTGFAAPGSSDPLGSSNWNLQVLPTVSDSILRQLTEDIPGVTSPMLYMGMLFATFAWHVEDQYLYSINYQHTGAAKTWYGVPASDADGFEDVAQRLVYRKAVQAALQKGKSPAEVSAAVVSALMEKTTMFSPRLLMKNGLHVSRAVQEPGEFILTFPRGYHGGFSNGFCIGEAANFATVDWFRFGAESCLRYSRLMRPPMLGCEQLLCQEAQSIQHRVERGEEVGAGAIVLSEYAAFFMEYAQRMTELTKRGAETKTGKCKSQSGISCDFCGHVSYLAHALIDLENAVCCLRCACKRPGNTIDFIYRHQCLPAFQALAAAVAYNLKGDVMPSSTLRMEGLTELAVWGDGKEVPLEGRQNPVHATDPTENAAALQENEPIPQQPAKPFCGPPLEANEASRIPASCQAEGIPAPKQGMQLRTMDTSGAVLDTLDPYTCSLEDLNPEATTSSSQDADQGPPLALAEGLQYPATASEIQQIATEQQPGDQLQLTFPANPTLASSQEAACCQGSLAATGNQGDMSAEQGIENPVAYPSCPIQAVEGTQSREELQALAPEPSNSEAERIQCKEGNAEAGSHAASATADGADNASAAATDDLPPCQGVQALYAQQMQLEAGAKCCNEASLPGTNDAIQPIWQADAEAADMVQQQHAAEPSLAAPNQEEQPHTLPARSLEDQPRLATADVSRVEEPEAAAVQEAEEELPRKRKRKLIWPKGKPQSRLKIAEAVRGPGNLPRKRHKADPSEALETARGPQTRLRASLEGAVGIASAPSEEPASQQGISKADQKPARTSQEKGPAPKLSKQPGVALMRSKSRKKTRKDASSGIAVQSPNKLTAKARSAEKPSPSKRQAVKKKAKPKKQAAKARSPSERQSNLQIKPELRLSGDWDLQSAELEHTVSTRFGNPLNVIQRHLDHWVKKKGRVAN